MVRKSYGGFLLDNPPAVAGAISGVAVALTTVVLERAVSPPHHRSQLPAVALGALLGGAAGKAVQRWTWSDARVREELLEAEHALEA